MLTLHFDMHINQIMLALAGAHFHQFIGITLPQVGVTLRGREVGVFSYIARDGAPGIVRGDAVLGLVAAVGTFVLASRRLDKR